MVPVQMTWTTMELVALVSLCVLTRCGTTFAAEHGRGYVKVVVMEGDNAILPCSPLTKENMESKLFDWKKGQLEVFLYDGGSHYNKDLSGQDEQFKRRVSHFQDQLKSGNTSIIIHNTKVTDSGNYTCAFPRLQPAGQMNTISLTVDPILKDRTGEISGASQRPYVSICNVTDVGVQLRCEVQEAFPQPKLQWQDSDGNDLQAEETQVSERGGRYSVILQTTVKSTSTNCFHCVAKQENINHVVTADITVPEKLFEEKTDRFSTGLMTGLFSGAVIGGLIGVLLTVMYYQNCRNRGGDEPVL